jgi:hypothetical protein
VVVGARQPGSNVLTALRRKLPDPALARWFADCPACTRYRFDMTLHELHEFRNGAPYLADPASRLVLPNGFGHRRTTGCVDGAGRLLADAAGRRGTAWMGLGHVESKCWRRCTRAGPRLDPRLCSIDRDGTGQGLTRLTLTPLGEIPTCLPITAISSSCILGRSSARETVRREG